MLGAITGDVVGSAYEFHNTKYYKFEMFPKGASFTDDSVMTLAVTPCWNHSWEGRRSAKPLLRILGRSALRKH